MLAAVGLRNIASIQLLTGRFKNRESDQDHSSNTDRNLKNPVIMILENMQGW